MTVRYRKMCLIFVYIQYIPYDQQLLMSLHLRVWHNSDITNQHFHTTEFGYGKTVLRWQMEAERKVVTNYVLHKCRKHTFSPKQQACATGSIYVLNNLETITGGKLGQVIYNTSRIMVSPPRIVLLSLQHIYLIKNRKWRFKWHSKTSAS